MKRFQIRKLHLPHTINHLHLTRRHAFRPMNLFFCGSPDFAVPTLESLVVEKYADDLVITNLDEPSGRGYELKAPPVKQAALRAGLEVYQPAKLKDPATVEFLTRHRPDAIVVVAYG